MKNFIKTTIVFLGLMSTLSAKVYEYTDGNSLTLLEDPSAAVEHKIDLINKARHHVHILTFFWDETGVPKRMAEALNAANARGVEVRILTTFMPTLTTDFTGKGRKLLNKNSKTATFSYLALTPGRKFSITHNLHEKVFIVDGEKAIIGGRNVSDSSLNGKDMEVEMVGPVVNQVQDHFKVMYDFVLKHKKIDKCPKVEAAFDECNQNLSKLKFQLEDNNFFPSQPTFSNGVKARILSHEAIIHHYNDRMNKKERLNQRDDILETVLNIKFKKLKAYNYFLLPTDRFMNYLERNLTEGNSIEMIINSIDSGKFSSNAGYIYALPDTLKLVNMGLKLFGWEKNQKMSYVHEKVLVFDEDHVIIGSHNLVTGSTSVSNELSVEFFSKEIADRLTTVFDQEISDRSITRLEDAELLEREIKENKNKIKLFRFKFIGSYLRELY